MGNADHTNLHDCGFLKGGLWKSPLTVHPTLLDNFHNRNASLSKEKRGIYNIAFLYVEYKQTFIVHYSFFMIYFGKLLLWVEEFSLQAEIHIYMCNKCAAVMIHTCSKTANLKQKQTNKNPETKDQAVK